MRHRTFVIYVFLLLLTLALPARLAALEQIINGGFTTNANNWSVDNGVDFADLTTLAYSNADGDPGGSFLGYFRGPGGSDNQFFSRDGMIWQVFPQTLRASDSVAAISISYKLDAAGNNKDWRANINGTIRNENATGTVLTSFLTLAAVGAAGTTTSWLRTATTTVTLAGGNQFRMHFYWLLSLQQNKELRIYIDRINCNLSPSGLYAVETPAGNCELRWNPSVAPEQTVSSYRIYRKTDLSADWGAPIATGITGTSYVDSAVPVAETVYYAVTDLAGTVESPKSPHTYFKTARLNIVKVEAIPSTVTVSQTGIPVKVHIENPGITPALVSQLSLYFTPPPVGPVGEYSYYLFESLPATIAGGQTRIFTFYVDILPTEKLALDIINAAATGTNAVAVPPKTLVATFSQDTHTWLIRSPADLVVTSIAVPPIVYRDQKDIEILVEVINDGDRNAAGYWDETTFNFSQGIFDNIRLLDTLPVPVYPGTPVSARYLVDVSPFSATGTCIVDAAVDFRDVNLLTPSINQDGAEEPGICTIVAGLLKTYKGPPKFPAYIITSESFNRGNNIVYARSENLQPLSELRFRWYNPSGTEVRVTDPPLTTDHNGMMSDQLQLSAGSATGTWRVIATRINSSIPLAESNFYVVTPGSITVTHQLPPSVSNGQFFTATSTIINSGGAQIEDAYCNMLSIIATSTGGATFISGPTPVIADVQPFGQTTFTWRYRATSVGSFTVQGSGAGYDANDLTTVQAATQTSNMAIIQSAPILSIVSLTENHTTVYRNQQGLRVNMLIQNTGEAGAFIDVATLSFSPVTATHSQSVLSPAMPVFLGGGSSALITFEVAVGTDSTTGWVNVSGSFSAYEANDASVRHNVPPTTINNAWQIMPVAGVCSARGDFTTEQYTFNMGQNLFTRFFNLTPGDYYKIFLYDPLGVERGFTDASMASVAGVFGGAFTVTSLAGAQYLAQWRLQIRRVKSQGGDYNPIEIVGEQLFSVQAQGQLTSSISMTPQSCSLGDYLTVTMLVTNPVATSSTIEQVAPTMPVRAPGFSGSFNQISGPEPPLATVRFGAPATFTWTLQTTDYTSVGNYLAVIATATGVDQNTVKADAASLRYVTSPAAVSNNVTVMFRNMQVLNEPLILGAMVCGTTQNFPFILKNAGNTHLRKVHWQKAYPTNLAGTRISYDAFSFAPDNGFSVATTTVNTACNLIMNMPLNQETGTYTALMSVFDDLNNNNVKDIEEPFDDFTVQVIASDCRVVIATNKIIELGSWPPGATTASVSLAVVNGGNLNLSNLKLAPGPKTFALTNVAVLMNPPYSVATDAVKFASASAIIGNDAIGQHIATWTIWEDHLNNGSIDVGEAFDTFQVRFSIGSKTFSITPDPLDLGNGTPTQTLFNLPFSITNTGQLPIKKPAVRMNDLTYGARTIPFENLLFNLPGTINPGETKVGTVSLYIPAGTATGTFSGLQYIYDDENNDGLSSGNINEPEKAFEIRITVNPYFLIQVIPESVSLQGISPGEPPATTGFLCRNAGNINLINLKWEKTPLFDGPLQIAADRYFFTPVEYFTATYSVTFISSITIDVLPGQPHGYYSGNHGRLLNESGVASTSDYFTIYCQVGSKSLDILETPPLTAIGGPNSITPAVNFRVKNTGTLVLAKVRCKVIGDLVSGTWSMPATSCNFSPLTFEALTSGQTKSSAWTVQIPAGQEIGTYTGSLLVWDDTDGDWNFDITEAFDIIDLHVGVVGKRVITVNPSPADLFYIPAGQSASMELIIQNTGNVSIPGPAEVILVKKGALNPVSPGPLSINEAQITFSPVPLANGLPLNSNSVVNLQVSVPLGQSSGQYQGYQTIYIDHNPKDGNYQAATEESFNLLVKLIVGQKKLSVSPFSLNMGSSNPTLPGIITPLFANFEARNLTTIPLSKLKWHKVQLSSGGDSMPVSAFTFLPAGPFNISSNGLKGLTASLTVPMHQPPGVYSGIQMLYEDENNNNTPDLFEASATFALSVTVNTLPAIQFTPTSVNFGDVNAAESTAPADVMITNLGNTSLTGLNGMWSKADLIGAGTINSSLISISPIPDPLPIASYALFSVQVGPIAWDQPFGTHIGNQALMGKTLQLRLRVAGGPPGPELPAGTLYQVVATEPFSIAADTVILSAYTSATGSVSIAFIETKEDETQVSYHGIDVNLATRNVTQSGPDIADAGFYHVERIDDMDWYRIFFAFKYQFKETIASKTYIILRNSTPDADLAIASYTVWFDGIQLEKAVIPGQTRPTTYGSDAKLISPSKDVSLDGKHHYYEW